MTVVTEFHLPSIEDLDVDDLASLPKENRYELHEGNLVVMSPSSYWHKRMALRIAFMLCAAGFDALLETGIRGNRRDLRLPDVGVLIGAPPEAADYSNLPGSLFSLVVEVVSENSLNGEYTDKARWYADQGIAEYWIVDRTQDKSHVDAIVLIHRLLPSGGNPAYSFERGLRLSELEAEYRAKHG